jgi:PPOX class probable F420-dependent enzyme
MRVMTEQEWREFVSAGTRTGKVATVHADGQPHVAPVWFVLDGADLIFTTGRDTVKGRALTRDQRAALCVDDENPPFSFVLVEGRVTISEDPAALLAATTRIAARYMGDELAEQYGARNAVPGELLVRLHTDRVVAHAALAD